MYIIYIIIYVCVFVPLHKSHYKSHQKPYFFIPLDRFDWIMQGP